MYHKSFLVVDLFFLTEVRIIVLAWDLLGSALIELNNPEFRLATSSGLVNVSKVCM